MIYAGIDYSMTSPSACIGKDQSVLGQKFLAFGSDKQVGQVNNANILPYPSWNIDQERYHKLATKVIEFLIEHEVDLVFIEGYSFGGKGRVFHLAENTGLLKYMLWKERFEYKVIAPTTIKKHATGSGRQDKEVMYKQWLERGGYDYNQSLSPKSTKIQAPQNDMIDSYFIMSCGISQET